MEIFWFVLVSFIGGLLGLVVFLFHLNKGQFEDIEEPKYQMFREEEEDAKISK